MWFSSLPKPISGSNERIRTVHRRAARRLIVELLEGRRVLAGIPLEFFDGVTAPDLPAGWSSVSATGAASWTTLAITSDSAPNHAFVPNLDLPSDTRLNTLPFTATTTQVRFRHSYNTELNFDGGVLEISINGGAFADILVAGGSFVEGGYNGTLDPNPNLSNPLVGRPAWTGDSFGYQTVTVNLPNNAINQSVVLRWRFGTDVSIGVEGWRIDNVTLEGAIKSIDLSELSSSIGTRVVGPAAFFNSGYSVSDAGDVNGDGYDDVIIGAPYNSDSGGTIKGESYVIFGKSNWSSTPNIDLASLGTDGITFVGQSADDRSGFSVSSAGDIDGDGFGDLIVGAPALNQTTGTRAGRSHVVFGKANWSTTSVVTLSNNISLSNPGVRGVTISGQSADDYSGISVSSAGDVNADGYDDLIVGAHSADPGSPVRLDAGKSYVIFGKSNWNSTSSITLSDNLSTTNPGVTGITIFGQSAGNESGISVSSAGDLNSDGYDDLVIGAPRAESSSGKSYVIFGSTTLPVTITLSDNLAANNPGVAGITIVDTIGGSPPSSGRSISSAGDVNGDGFDDLLVGAYNATLAPPTFNPPRFAAGKSYVVFGGTTLPTMINLDSLGAAGITIVGETDGDNSGFSVSRAGDVNGDGFDDVIVGAKGADVASIGRTDAGKSYVIFGETSLPSTIDLVNIVNHGVVILGQAANDNSGSSVSGAGDVNGDGFDDLIIGAPNSDPMGRSNAGSSYILFGSNHFTNSIDPSGLGDNLDNTLFGFSGAEIINGADGDDTLFGDGGADVVLGGRGNDTLAAGIDFKRIVGGNGFDTLRIQGGGGGAGFLTLDLTAIADNRIMGIERIDISALESIVLNDREVVNLSDTSNTLEVVGSSRVTLDLGWSQGSDIPGFRVFTKRAATLHVQTGIAVDSSIRLAQLGSTGVTINGASNYDLSGASVSDAGDVNGDGFDDFIIGASQANPAAGSLAGKSYVVFGGPSLPPLITLADNLGPTVGFTIFGQSAYDFSGTSVSSAGDVNGDGFDDLIIGATSANFGGNGKSYVIFGKTSFPQTITLSDSLGAAVGFTIQGEAFNDQTGISVSSGGDVNGDGFDDLVVGAHNADPSTLGPDNNAGKSYVIFGKVSFPATITLSESLGVAGFTFLGSAVNDRSGLSVSDAGDVNGDGFDDLVIGARYADPASAGPGDNRAGKSYVIFGKASFPQTITLSDSLSPTVGFTIFGQSSGDSSGFSVSTAGDVNGDGFDDLILGAPQADSGSPTQNDAGKSYVIFGKESFPAAITLSDNLGSLVGFTILGEVSFDNSGNSVSGAGDVNGDGFDDLLVGASGGALPFSSSYSQAGKSYVIFGKPDWSLTPTIALSDSLTTAGLTLLGPDGGGLSGSSVSNAGDVNGDGFDDLIIGAPFADVNVLSSDENEGKSFVVYGGNGFTNSILNANLGGNGPDFINGDSAANIINGGRGSDTLVGNGGEDILQGGSGNDIIAVGDLTFKRIVGGNGTDSLVLDGSGLTLDLTAIRDNRIVDIEVIDIIGSGDNTLTLDLSEVLNLSSSSNRLVVRRNAGDTVNIGTGWTLGGLQLINSEIFQTYTQGNATLLVQETNPVGTDGDDTLVLTYLSTTNTGNFSLTRSTNSGPIVNLGVFPMNAASIIDGLGGNDSLQIKGTTGTDTFVVTNTGLVNNGHNLVLVNFESRILAGDNGADTYRFDTDDSLGSWNLDESVGGTDTIDFALTTAQAVALNLGQTSSQAINPNLALILGPVSGFENVIGGSRADTLTGNAVANSLSGGPGNDILNGVGGNDNLSGGLDNDTYVFDGPTSAEADIVNEADNQGTDTLSFTAITTAVNLNLGSLAVQPVHASRTLKLNSQATFENIIGGSGPDALTGNTLNNVLTGGPGNDTLVGAAGNDTLIGGLNDDTYVFGTATTLEADVVQEQTGEGTDTLSFSTIATAVSLNLGSLAVQPVHASRTLKLNSQTTFENIIGGAGPDALTGNTLNNVLTGGTGNDTLAGAAGNDTLIGGLNDDTYIFGTATALEADVVQEQTGQGTDTLTFSTLQTAVALDLSLITAQPIHTNRTLQLNSATAFENAIGGKGGDTLTGNTLNNVLNGGPGLDTLNGAAGSDTLIGGLQNDTYIFSPATSPEADQVQEAAGQGLDTLSFASLATSVTLNLGSLAVQPIHANRTLKLNAQTTFENIIGGSAADTLTGNLLNNSLTGNAGNDVLVGGAGSDTLFGGLDNDTYIFATAATAESDFLIEVANQGTDTISFASVATGVSLNLASSLDQAVHFNRMLKLNSGGSFENATGGAGNDILLGNNLNNSLIGGNGSNVLVGSGGADVLSAGTGRDILIGGLGLDTLGGGSGDDILIAGRTLSDTSVANLLTIQTEWISLNTYATRITNLRAGLLTALSDVLNDAGDDDNLTGGADSDWYFAAVDDAINGLFGGEIVDSL